MSSAITTSCQKRFHNHDDNAIVNCKQPSVHDRIRLIFVDDEYSCITKGTCGTVTGVDVINDVFKSVKRDESIIWVKWDNGVELGLIEGVDKYEIISAADV